LLNLSDPSWPTSSTPEILIRRKKGGVVYMLEWKINNKQQFPPKLLFFTLLKHHIYTYVTLKIIAIYKTNDCNWL
jgi:hypothetical protein